MIIGVVALIIGIIVAAAGVYFLLKESGGPESKKIYTITLILGLVVMVFGLAKLFLFGG